MFGFGRKKNNDKFVKLSDKEIKKLEKGMSKKELKEFRKRQKDARSDALWEETIMQELFDEDYF